MSRSVDRGWMYDVDDADRFLSDTFCSNLDVFLDFAFSNKAFVDNNRIKCPCLECDNKHFKTRNDVMFHLYENGFTPNYTTWFAHGETTTKVKQEGESCGLTEDGDAPCTLMVVDAMGPTNLNRNLMRYESSSDSNVLQLEGIKGCCQKYSRLGVNSDLLKWKSRCNISNAVYNELISIIMKQSNGLPLNETKKILKKHSVLNVPYVSPTDSRLSIFKYPSQRLPENIRQYRFMTDIMPIAHRYILLNCEEVKPFVRLFDDLTRQEQPDIDEIGLDIYRDQNFAEWFKNYVSQESNGIGQDLKDLAQGPLNGNWTYGGYLVNGYKFYTQKHSEGRLSNKSGVCVSGSVYNEYECDYYGILDDVIEVEYQSKIHGLGDCVVVLFKCKWFDTPGGVGVKRKDDLVHIDSKVKLLDDNPFVLASQTEQVHYGPYPRMSKELQEWWDVIKSQDEVKENI